MGGLFPFFVFGGHKALQHWIVTQNLIASPNKYWLEYAGVINTNQEDVINANYDGVGVWLELLHWERESEAVDQRVCRFIRRLEKWSPASEKVLNWLKSTWCHGEVLILASGLEFVAREGGGDHEPDLYQRQRVWCQKLGADAKDPELACLSQEVFFLIFYSHLTQRSGHGARRKRTLLQEVQDLLECRRWYRGSHGSPLWVVT